MRIFLYTLRVFSPTPAGRVPVSSRPSGAQSHRFATGPGLANIRKIKPLRGGDLRVAAQANVQMDAEIGQKDHFRMEAVKVRKINRRLCWDDLSVAGQAKVQMDAEIGQKAPSRIGNE